MRKIVVWGGVLLAAASFTAPPSWASDKIRVVATMGTLGDFARQIMGADAEVYVVAKPGRDIHFIQPTPKDVLKVKKADVLIHGGLDLETWRQPLLNAAGNLNFLGSAPRAIDVSAQMELLEVPQSLSRLDGDIHAFGNPHYWTDPENALRMIRTLTDELAALYPNSAPLYRANAAKLLSDLDQAFARWKQQLAPYRGTAFVTYHKSWPYFAKRFGFEVVGYIEPKPGIPPTARHLQELTRHMKEKNVRFVVKETYNESRAADKVANEAGVSVVTLMQFAGEERTSTYVEMMNKNVERIVRALSN